MPTVLITGGTGTIGKKLSALLVQKGYDVIILTRHSSIQPASHAKISYAKWDIVREEIDETAVARSDYIIHLAGAGVAEKRWTAKRKVTITESRTKTSALLVKALQQIPNKVKAVIAASAAGYYGLDNLLSLHDGFTEDDKPANDFLANVCVQWEKSIEPVQSLNKRLVILRTGIVLSKNGGAFIEFLKPMRYGIATILGTGKQIVSWIHELDICNMYLHALENEQLSGPYNAVAPHPATNKELILTIARNKHQIYLPLFVPKFILKLVLGELSVEVLKSAHLSASAIENTGFHFSYPGIGIAVKNLLN